MPLRRPANTALANVISAVPQSAIWLANSTWVPFSTSETKRICGYALVPRLAPGRPKASSLTSSSAASNVLPSKLTNRHLSYQAPRVAATAIGFTTSSCSCRSGSHPSRVRACEIADLPATVNSADGLRSHCVSSSRQRNTSRYDELHVQRHGDHVIHHDLRRKISLPDAGGGCRLQNRLNPVWRKASADYAKADVVRDSRTLRKLCQRTRHPADLLFLPEQDTARMFLSEQY